MSNDEGAVDFFISYTKADLPWAEWIAWQLEAAGYTTLLQAWDFRPGSNFVLELALSQEIPSARRVCCCRCVCSTAI